MDAFEKSELIAKIIGIVWISCTVIIFAKIIYDENERSNQGVSTHYVVVESGCITHKYKVKNLYDCSVVVSPLNSDKIEKMVLDLGVLPSDKIVKTCYPTVGWATGFCKISRNR